MSKDRSLIDDLLYVRAVAMAINGPHSAVNKNSRYSLTDLRVVRWRQLTDQEQRYLMRQACAVLRQAKVTERNEAGEYPAVGLEDV